MSVFRIFLLTQLMLCILISSALFLFFTKSEATSFFLGMFSVLIANYLYSIIFFSVTPTLGAKKIYSAAVAAMIVRWVIAIVLILVAFLFLKVDSKFYLIGFVLALLGGSFFITKLGMDIKNQNGKRRTNNK